MVLNSSSYGNANEWGHRARREGYRVDNTPAIGSIAWSTKRDLWSCCLGDKCNGRSD